MSAKFDFEQELLNCWGVLDDIQSVIDNGDHLDDTTLNALIGIKQLYTWKFEKCWSLFEAALY